MSAVADRAAELKAALKQTGIQTLNPGESIVDPPAIVLGPPELAWESFNTAPTSATFAVIVCEAAAEDFMGRLLVLVETVAAAIDASGSDLAVMLAVPTAWSAGGTELPAYRITVEAGI